MKSVLFLSAIGMAAATLSTAALAAGPYNTLSGNAPIVIGHRGASGYLPEHTLEAYALAIAQGANYIEPDLVMSKDGALLARHEPMLARVNLDAAGNIVYDASNKPILNRTDTSTNVWELPQYNSRLTVKTLDGVRVGGWFVEDFTAAEIRSDIRAQERLRDLRSNANNNKFVIPTLQEVITLAQSQSAATGRTIGIYPETKHPTYFAAHAAANKLARMEDVLVNTLKTNYVDGSAAPVFIQSFEVSNLQYINRLTNIQIVQLLNGSGQPFDFTVAGDLRTYADLASATGLGYVNDYADGIGPSKTLIIPTTGTGVLGTPTTLVADAHAKQLLVHAFTFRAENTFLPNEFDSSASPAAFGDAQGEMLAYLKLGLDGFFTDQPDIGVSAVRAIPEPQTYALMLGGLALVGALARRRR